MAVQHIALNPTATHANLVRGPVSQIQSGVRALIDSVATLGLMIDGDGSQDAHYVYMADKIGAADGAAARAVYNELLSVKGKLDNDAQVSFVNAAINQAANKFR